MLFPLLSALAVALLTLAIALAVYRHRLLDIPYAWWAFILDDLASYWFHRTAIRARWRAGVPS
jgi:sterol desaturase/sphingolipid hydroxylase (fatty acid hydroxylase superfamily)